MTTPIGVDQMVRSLPDWDAVLSRLPVEKRARYRAYANVISSLDTPSQSLFVVDDDNEFNTFVCDFSEFLQISGIIEEGSREPPFYVVKIGYDGDMLDDMLRIVISQEAHNFRPAEFKDELMSKQTIFQYLYKIITKNKFLMFHIPEFPLAYYFETSVVVDVQDLADVLDPAVHDATIVRYLNDLRTLGPEELRRAYSFFYRISASLLMELSNIFLVVPTAGMYRHLVVTSWRTQTLLLGFSPLTWSSGSFTMYDLSGRDIDGRWAFPVKNQTSDPREKGYTRLVPLR